jgi:hypothetical protein
MSKITGTEVIRITASKYIVASGDPTTAPPVQISSQSCAQRIRWIELMQSGPGPTPLWHASARLPERDTVPHEESSAPPLDEVTSFGVLDVSVTPISVTCGIKSHVSAADPAFVSSKTHASEAQHNTSPAVNGISTLHYTEAERDPESTILYEPLNARLNRISFSTGLIVIVGEP